MNKKLVFVKSAWARGYISRLCGSTTICPITAGRYKGMYRNYSPSWESTQYMTVNYYRDARESDPATIIIEVEVEPN